MDVVDYDVKQTFLLEEDSIDKRDNNYSYIFFSSNEELVKLFSYVDFTSKRVLSVASSGDQAFHAYDLGAEKVDLFDINKLTLYYFYLRLWGMKYLNKYYLDLQTIGQDLSELLSLVKPCNQDEEIAYLYWERLYNYCQTMYSQGFDFFAYYVLFLQQINFDNIISDYSKIIDKIDKNNINFYNIDVSGDVSEINDRYDIILTSNIADFLNGDRLIIFRENLYNLLNDNGSVILSNVQGDLSHDKKVVLEERFNVRKLPEYKSWCGYNIPMGNILTKK